MQQSTNPLSTVYTSLCVPIVKAALSRGVVMLRDVAWELRNGKLRSTTATTGQRRLQPPASTARRSAPAACHRVTTQAEEHHRDRGAAPSK